MDEPTKEQLRHALRRLRRTNLLAYHKVLDPTALSLMKSIEDNSIGAKGNTYLSDLQGELGVTKGAISHIANNLEKKGYLNREIDKENRRKLIVTLTQDGREAMKQADEEFDEMLTFFLSRLGEDDSHEVIRLFNQFANIAVEFMEGLK